jgi:A/G-specific adenine glycosylase
VRAWCAGYRTGAPERYPVKLKKAERPHRTGVVWVLRDSEGRVALVRRPDKGLLGGMLGLPTSEWSVEPVESQPPVDAAWRDAGGVEHVFTHFSLSLTVQVAQGSGEFVWTPAEEALAALPTVFKKALERGLA